MVTTNLGEKSANYLPSKTKYYWSLVIPAYNEQDNIIAVLTRALEFLSGISDHYEVILVNDGSADRTGIVADEFAQKHPQVKVIHHPQNRGIGSAWQTLYQAAQGDVIVTCPADQQFDPRDFRLCLPFLDQADIISCYRNIRQDNLLRLAISKVDELLIKKLLEVNVRDINWVKIYKKWVLKETNYKSTSPFIETEIFIRARQKGAKVIEVAAPHYPRKSGKEKGGSIKNIYTATFDLLKFYRSIRSSG